MRSPLAWFVAASLLAVPSALRADEVHLTNGRVLVGKVVSHTADLLTLEVQGGRFAFSAKQVARVELKATPEEQFGERARDVDMSDPAQVQRLAKWARDHGLSARAEQLESMVKGLELQRRVDAVRGSGRATDYLTILAWAGESGYSLEVRRWLAEQACAAEPDHEEARRALRRLEDEAARAAQQAAEAEARAQEAAAAERERRVQAIGRIRAQRARMAEVRALEAELQRQRGETEALRERLDQLEDQGRWTRRRRRVVAPPSCEDPGLQPIMRRPLLRPARPRAKVKVVRRSRAGTIVVAPSGCGE